jgi:hypothetical protein
MRVQVAGTASFAQMSHSVGELVELMRGGACAGAAVHGSVAWGRPLSSRGAAKNCEGGGCGGSAWLGCP